ncbi:metal ABC transporter permease [Marinomonas posidonica]|uniref:ABC-type transporter, integral membrane subunit n=1 Tax=Marinomonas posidonica (strain CECT 7376 / NCIMB 14433 / IVIA-Po-181) TaxID=491952 RepID=F6D132_MARPP|nr:metal ABC transporter permease [Marinomonas posidonica]AEF54839.1 ABC-type transporter, integral membrane subunit [Marinomonas posidonica IVIA-Po-181]
MSIYDLAVAPFYDYGFMRRALVASVGLGLGAGPVGVILMLRRMSLIGDAMSHAVLPGAAIGFMIAGGLSLPIMGLGALIAGLSVATLSGIVSRTTALKEDASFASFYLASLALGVLLISLKGSNIDLLHVLFGTILAIDVQAMYLIGGITSVTLILLAIIYRPLVVECFDPRFLRSVHGKGVVYHGLFLLLVVLNLVAGFQTLGTLMAVGMMMLPAVISQLWAKTLPYMMMVATLSAALSGLVGLLISFHLNLASGPTIILTATVFYLLSLVLSPAGIFYKYLPKQRSLQTMENNQ